MYTIDLSTDELATLRYVLEAHKYELETSREADPDEPEYWTDRLMRVAALADSLNRQAASK